MGTVQPNLLQPSAFQQCASGFNEASLVSMSIQEGGHSANVESVNSETMRYTQYEEMSQALQAMVQDNAGEPLPDDRLELFLETSFLPLAPHGKGSRRGAAGYLCRWPGCGKEITRHDHALAHVAAHAGSKPRTCMKW